MVDDGRESTWPSYLALQYVFGADYDRVLSRSSSKLRPNFYGLSLTAPSPNTIHGSLAVRGGVPIDDWARDGYFRATEEERHLQVLLISPSGRRVPGMPTALDLRLIKDVGLRRQREYDPERAVPRPDVLRVAAVNLGSDDLVYAAGTFKEMAEYAQYGGYSEYVPAPRASRWAGVAAARSAPYAGPAGRLEDHCVLCLNDYDSGAHRMVQICPGGHCICSECADASGSRLAECPQCRGALLDKFHLVTSAGGRGRRWAPGLRLAPPRPVARRRW